MGLNWFHFLAIVDRAIMNEDAQASLWLDMAPFSACPEAMSCGNSDFSLLRPLNSAFHSGAPVCTSTNSQ